MNGASQGGKEYPVAVHSRHVWRAILLLCAVTGSAQAQIEIDSIEELQLIGQNPSYPLDGHYVLTQDIDASDTVNWNDGAGFDPIGERDVFNWSLAFSGILDGQGHTVRDLYIHRPEEDYVGLVGFATEDAEFLDVHIEACHIQGDSSVGGLAGSVNGTVSNCSATGWVRGWAAVGGLAGRAGGEVTHCYAQAEVLYGTYCGGLLGSMSGVVSKCYAVSNVQGFHELGGLVGLNFNGQIEDSFAFTMVIGSGPVGGLVGVNGGSVTNCFSSGWVEGDLNFGGLVGVDVGGSDAVVLNSFWDMPSSGQETSTGGTGATTEAMTHAAMFADAGWDFSETWAIEEGGTYPYLQEVPFPQEEVTLSISVDGEGTVTAAPDAAVYRAGTPVTLTAVAGEGYSPMYWQVEDSPVAGIRTNPLVVALGMDRTVTAVIRPSVIELHTIEELQRILSEPDYPHDWDYALANDIDASATARWNGGRGFRPIGSRGSHSSHDPIYVFEGTLDGRSHVIRNLVVDVPDQSGVGIFKYAHEAYFHDIILEDVNVIGGDYTGSLVGSMSEEGTIERCRVSGTVSGAATVGGLAGSSRGDIHQCHSLATVSGEAFVGGLAGASYGDIKECHSVATVSGQDTVGGLVGITLGGTLTDSYASGHVSGGTTVGGLLGDAKANFLRCYSTATVAGDAGVGGLVGIGMSRSSNESYWDTVLSGVSVSDGGMGLPTEWLVWRWQYETWDFATVWDICPGVSHPFLRNLPTIIETPCEEEGDGTPLRIVSVSPNRRVVEGQSVTLSVEVAGGTGRVEKLWYKGGGYIFPLVGGEFTISPVTLDDGDFYACEVSDLVTTIVSEPIIIEVTRGQHSADTNEDHRVSLSELLRVIQFHSTGGLHCAETSEDGFAPGPGDTTQCAPHDGDYAPLDWTIDLSELLRLVQLYNQGGYHACPASDPATEDGFCVGAG